MLEKYNEQFNIERFDDKIYLYENGSIVMVMEDIGQTNSNLVESYKTIQRKFNGNEIKYDMLY